MPTVQDKNKQPTTSGAQRAGAGRPRRVPAQVPWDILGRSLGPQDPDILWLAMHAHAEAGDYGPITDDRLSRLHANALAALRNTHAAVARLDEDARGGMLWADLAERHRQTFIDMAAIYDVVAEVTEQVATQERTKERARSKSIVEPYATEVGEAIYRAVRWLAQEEGVEK